MRLHQTIRVTLLLVVGPSLASAEEASHQWGQWRGPLGTGVAPHGNPPVSWGEDTNLRWKAALPGRGLATPVVWGDRIFVLTTVPDDPAAYAASLDAAQEKAEKRDWPPDVRAVKQRFVVQALSRRDGRVLWERTATTRVPHESHYLDSSWASGSPVTDGRRLIAHFGSSGTFAYDLDGNLLWEVDLGDMTTRRGFGEGTSPALHGDILVINWDHEGDSFLVALDASTGNTRWRTERPGEVTSWSTPLILADAPRPQVVVAATGRSRGYDLATGEEIWSLGGMTVNTIPTPVAGGGLVYLASGYQGQMLQAVEVSAARGPLEDASALRWTYERDTPYVPSLLLSQGRVWFVKHFRDVLSCLDARTGEVVIPATRMEGIDSVWASPVAAAGRVYVVGRNGTALVLEDGPEYRVLATNTLDDGFDASPAIAGDDLFLRGRKHLYAITTGPGGSAPPPAAGEDPSAQPAEATGASR